MKFKIIPQFIFAIGFILTANEVQACHALAVQDYTLTVVGNTVQVNASSTSPTCGCDEFWLDIEVRCVNEPFDGAPFDPTQYLALNTYPYFQSAQMLKPDCIVQAYPMTAIPFTSLCPGTDYQVRVRENNNGNGGPWSSALTFTVPGTSPTLDCDVTASSTNICVGDCADIEAVITGGCGLAASYDWSNLTAGPPASCTYSICLYDTFGDGWNGGSVSVVVNGVTVHSNITVATGSGPACFDFTVSSGQSITVNYSAGSWSSENYYVIYGGPGGTGTQVQSTPQGQTPPASNSITNNCGGTDLGSPSQTVCPTTTTTYDVIITELCSNQTVTCAVTIQVLPPPVAGTASISETSVCANQTVDLSLAGSDGLIQWQSAPSSGGPWTNIPGATDPNYTTDPITSDMCFRAEITGCGPLVYANEVCVTVNPAPTVAVPDATICAGETTTLTATPSAAGGTYTWTPGGQTTNSISVSPATTTTYYVEYILNDCPGNDSALVTVNPVPTTLGLTDGVICDGESITLTTNPDVAGGDYLWSPGGETSASITVSPTVTTTYSLSYTVSGCVLTEDVEVVVNPIPVLTLNSPSVCGSEPAVVTASPTPAGGSFLWNTGETTNSISVSPAATTTYDVEYTLNGCVVAASATVSIAPNPVASFTFVNACTNALISMTNTSTGNIGTYEWDINNDGTIDYSTANASHSFASAGLYDVNLNVITTDGCENNITQTIEVFEIPVANFNVSTVCLGNDTEFENISSTSSGSITSYSWDFDDGNTSTLENPIHSYTNTGSYDVTLTVTSNNGCTHSFTQIADVTTTPTANFTVANECFYDALSFQNTSTAGIPNYSWDFGDGTTSNSVNPTHTYSSAGEYNVTLIIATNSNCGDTITQLVTAFHQPTADFDVTSVCQGGVNDFTDASTVNGIFGDNITNWSWSFDDGNSSTMQNPTHNYSTENVFNVTLQVTTNNGCTDDITLPVNVYPNPVANFTSDIVCFGFGTTFQDNSMVPSSNSPNSVSNWSWVFGDGGISTIQNPNYTYTSAGSFNATLTITTNNGCTDDVTLPVFVSEAPTVSFIGTNLEGCSPVCFELTSTTTSSSPIADLTWNFSNGATYNGAVIGDCFTNNTGNTISLGVELVATNTEGCYSSLLQPDFINIYHNPVAYFTYTPDNPDVLYSEVTFDNSSLHGDSYNWTIEGNAASTAFNPTVDFGETPDDYLVELIVNTSEGCSDTATSIVNVNDRIIFYVPNTFTPDNDQFNQFFTPIFTSGFDPYDYNLLIYNRWGEIIFESNNASIGWDGTYGGENTQIVKDGTYIWKIEFKETMTDKRHVQTGHVNVLR